MDAPRSYNAMLDAVAQSASTPVKAVLAALALALVVGLGAWGAHAADPVPDNPNTPLVATSVDEAVVAVVADHAYVQVDGQVVTGTGFIAPAGKPLSFEAYAEDGYALSSVFVADVYGNPVPIIGGLPAFTIDAEGVVDGLTITLETEQVRPNAGLVVEDEKADEAQPAAAEVVQATVVGQAAEYVYDGEPHTVAADVLGADGQPLEGFYAMATTQSFTNVTDGAVEVPLADVAIYNAEGVDVTANFDFDVQPGSISITPAPVTIKTPSATKVYDGTPLTADEMQLEIPGIEEFMEVAVTIAATGSQTQIGQSDNTYTLDWGTVDPANYQIDETLGTLIVSANEAPIVITLHDASRPYDGTPFTSNDFDLAAPSGYTATVVASGSQTDAGSSENAVASYAIYDAQGNDVTATFSDITTVPGTLTVEPAELLVTTPSAYKAYDGTPLTAAADGFVQGFVAGETATYRITGSQTRVGSSDNTYSLVWDGTAKQANYRIVEDLGVLAVTDPEPASDGGASNNNGGAASQAGSTANSAPANAASGNAGTATDAAAAIPAAAVEEVVEVIEVIEEAPVVTYVDAPAYESTPVSDTPNVTYLTPASASTQQPDASAATPDAGAGNGSSSQAPAAASTATGDDPAGAVATEGAESSSEASSAGEEVVEEEVLYDDATPLAGIDDSSQAASSPWAVLGAILLAALLALIVLFFVKRRSQKDDARA